MIIFVTVMIVTLVTSVAVAINKRKKIGELLKAGLVRKRDYGYANKGEAFTSNVGSAKNVAAMLCRLGVNCAISGDAAREVTFKGKYFTARLFLNSFDPATGRAVYGFNFTSYKTQKYVYKDEIGMNMLLTAIEKMFFTLDRNTTVSQYNVKYKTRYSIF